MVRNDKTIFFCSSVVSNKNNSIFGLVEDVSAGNEVSLNGRRKGFCFKVAGGGWV